jgi:5-methyltetrahydrofolate--homocysteine methyltransferase
MEPIMDLENIRTAIIDGDSASVVEGVKVLLAENTSPNDILVNAMIPAMTEVGDRFEQGEAYVPEMLISARAMKAGLEVLKPLLASSGVQPLATIALGTVQGDMHDIGKNLVAMMMEGAGFEVVDLGVDVPAEKFVQAAKDGVQIIGLSGLLTTTIPGMPEVIQALDKAGLRNKVKVIVGGAPVTEAFAQKIGADSFAPDASQAVKRAKELLGL